MGTLPYRLDTEVILAAYRQWGSECVRRFNGMWALRPVGRRPNAACSCPATASASSRSITPSPATAGTFAFASEIKGLLAGGVVSFRPSPAAVARYVAAGAHALATSTARRSSRACSNCPAATMRSSLPTSGRAHPYWSLPHDQPAR